jgi:hypothetical protein
VVDYIDDFATRNIGNRTFAPRSYILGLQQALKFLERAWASILACVYFKIIADEIFKGIHFGRGCIAARSFLSRWIDACSHAIERSGGIKACFCRFDGRMSAYRESTQPPLEAIKDAPTLRSFGCDAQCKSREG